MIIKKVGRMGAVLGLCLTITITTLGKVEAKTLDNNSKYYLNQIDNIEIPLDTKTLLTTKEYEELLAITKENEDNCTFDNSIDKYNLYNIINENSKSYLKDKSNYLLISDIKDEKIRKYIENTILDIINNVLLDKRRKDDAHKLLGLKLVFGDFSDTEELGEYFSDENLIVISLNNILKTSLTVDNLYMTLFDVINHEFNHLFQSPCSDNERQLKLSGETSVSFLQEASASSYNYNVLKCSYIPINKNFTYEANNLEERKYESKLFLLSILDNSYSINDYYSAIYKENTQEFCHYFNAYNEKDIKDLFSIIWLIDGRLVRNNYWSRLINSNDFSKLNDININKMLTDATDSVVETYLLKKCVSNLINYNSKKELLTLEENLILYHYILVNILDTAYYNDYDYVTNEVTYTFYTEFITTYKEVNEIFIEYLSSIYGYSPSEIISIYDNANKDNWLNDINNYVKNNQINSSIIANLINKFPKIRNTVQGGTYLSNFNYNNLNDVLNNVLKNSSGIKFILK